MIYILFEQKKKNYFRRTFDQIEKQLQENFINSIDRDGMMTLTLILV